MKYQQGDKVILLHSDEEGEIVDFINEKMVTVEVNGIRFPVHIDQIDFPYFRRFSKKSKPEPKKPLQKPEIPKKEKASARYQVGEGVWLIFLPVFDKDVFDDDVVEYFKVFLVNQTADHFIFEYRLKLGDDLNFELKNEILPWADFYLHNFKYENVNDSPRFGFEFSLKLPDKKRAPYLESVLKLKPRQVFQKVEETRKKQLAHFSYELFTVYPERQEEPDVDLTKLSKAGYRLYRADAAKAFIESPRTVIDLHADKLSDQWEKMTTVEILDMQLRTFEKYLELAEFHHQDSLIVIHGVGSGKLRDEIHDALRVRKGVKSFVNRYHPSFGYGATEIYFENK